MNICINEKGNEEINEEFERIKESRSKVQTSSTIDFYTVIYIVKPIQIRRGTTTGRILGEERKKQRVRIREMKRVREN